MTIMITLMNFMWITMVILYLQNFTAKTMISSASASLVIKYAQADSFFVNDLNIENKYLDELHIKGG